MPDSTKRIINKGLSALTCVDHVLHFVNFQVYQARLRANGKIVAVKVQRPGVQAAISLDIYILRYLAGIARRVGKLNTDLQVLVSGLVLFFIYFFSIFSPSFSSRLFLLLIVPNNRHPFGRKEKRRRGF